MLKYLREHSRTITTIIISVMCLILMICAVVMLAQYSSELTEEASVKADYYSKESSKSLDVSLSGYLKQAEAAVASIDSSDRVNWRVSLDKVVYEGRFGNLYQVRYFQDGKEYDVTGDLFELKEDPAVIKSAAEPVARCAGYIVDPVQNTNFVAFTVPIDSQFADSIVLLYYDELVTSLITNVASDYVFASEITAVCTAEGEVLNLPRCRVDDLSRHNNIYDYLRNKINDKSIIDKLRTHAANSGEACYPTQIGVEETLITIGCSANSKSAFSIISVYNARTLNSERYQLASTIIAVLIIFLVVMVAFMIFYIAQGRKADRTLRSLEDTDKRLGSPTRKKFERDVGTILDRHKATSFAVIVVEVRYFAYISSMLDAENVTRLLRHCMIIFEKALQQDETYGYLEHGRFAMLFHYRDRSDLETRLVNIGTLIRNYKGSLPSSYRAELFGGIFETSISSTNTPAEMVDFAIEAKDMLTTTADFAAYRYYGEELRKSHVMKEYIELHMESALANDNFVVFYQPKYNIANHAQDGCEALVRWYNPDKDEYMPPAIFMPLFEANGFICKMDRRVYELVCAYIDECNRNNRRVYPVSVNVSRETAAESDFLDFYINTKKKHRIANGFLTLEFTESFAYKDYEHLREIVRKLHENGIRCSIDDFGTGESSFTVLKELPMDEIKLDRSFLKKGITDDRDLTILKSTIKLGRDLGLKVTQEGVETEEQLKMLTELGCMVIQGYYYSKPLHLADYADFIEKPVSAQMQMK